MVTNPQDRIQQLESLDRTRCVLIHSLKTTIDSLQETIKAQEERIRMFEEETDRLLVRQMVLDVERWLFGHVRNFIPLRWKKIPNYTQLVEAMAQMRSAKDLAIVAEIEERLEGIVTGRGFDSLRHFNQVCAAIKRDGNDRAHDDLCPRLFELAASKDGLFDILDRRRIRSPETETIASMYISKVYGSLDGAP